MRGAIESELRESEEGYCEGQMVSSAFSAVLCSQSLPPNCSAIPLFPCFNVTSSCGRVQDHTLRLGPACFDRSGTINRGRSVTYTQLEAFVGEDVVKGRVDGVGREMPSSQCTARRHLVCCKHY